MSQQSNPATLREALTEARKVIVVACGDKAPYVKVALARIDAALAASGTEVAPVTCESCKSTNTQRYENAGGLKMYSCADCGWHHEVPTQAAASPEAAPSKPVYVLGRRTIEAVAEDGQLNTEKVAFIASDELFHQNPYGMRCPKCGQDVFLHGETCPAASLPQASPEGEGREAQSITLGPALTFQAGYHCAMCGTSQVVLCKHWEKLCDLIVAAAALRQSAAPSGGDLARELTIRMKNLPRFQNDLNTAVLVRLSDVLNLLAQESQTGAAPSRNRRKQNIPYRCGHDDCPCTGGRLHVANRALDRKLAGKTGAVTEPHE